MTEEAEKTTIWPGVRTAAEAIAGALLVYFGLLVAITMHWHEQNLILIGLGFAGIGAAVIWDGIVVGRR